MITPTVGRIVWFRSVHNTEPLAAIVTRVFNDRLVNLCVFDAHGVPGGQTSVHLVQDGDAKSSHNTWCEWMPYQKGQAAKTEALEAAAAK